MDCYCGSLVLLKRRMAAGLRHSFVQPHGLHTQDSSETSCEHQAIIIISAIPLINIQVICRRMKTTSGR